MSDNFIFYRSFWDGVKDLPQETMLRLITALCEYALNDVEPNLTGLERAVFTSWKANIDASQKRRENGKRGGRPKKDDAIPEPVVTNEKTNGFETENQWFSETKPNKKYKVNINDNDNDKNNTGKESAERETRFRKPTVDEVRAYCEERKNKIDAEQFWNYYESKGWKIGKSPMKSWKACVATWERYDKTRDAPARAKTQNRFLQIDNHEYDFDALEKELLAN